MGLAVGLLILAVSQEEGGGKEPRKVEFRDFCAPADLEVTCQRICSASDGQGIYCHIAAKRSVKNHKQRSCWLDYVSNLTRFDFFSFAYSVLSSDDPLSFYLLVLFVSP